MTIELNFSLEIAQQQWVLLLSKASNVPVQVIERLQAPLSVEEITEELLQQLDKLATTLEISVFDLLSTSESLRAFIARVVEMARQRGVEIRATSTAIGQPDPRMMSSEGESIALANNIFGFDFDCLNYAFCVARGGNCGPKPPEC